MLRYFSGQHLYKCMAHNINMESAADKAKEDFDKLFVLEPDNIKGNYLYGMFLCGIKKHSIFKVFSIWIRHSRWVKPMHNTLLGFYIINKVTKIRD